MYYCEYCKKELKDVSKLEEVEPLRDFEDPIVIIDIFADWMAGDYMGLCKEKHYCCEECSKSIEEAKAKALEVLIAKKEAEREAEWKFWHSVWGSIIFALFGIFYCFWWWPYTLHAFEAFLKH